MPLLLDWIPEPLPPSGGLSAEGFTKLLGHPNLDPLTVLIRETAQNSWDARDGSNKSVKFSLNVSVIPEEARILLRDEVFPGARRVVGTKLAEQLNSTELHGIFVSDRNTKGLGGPVRADVLDPTDSYDWVDFVLNVGKANQQGNTGGTYGFGKTISYVVSEASTIVIYSKTKHEGHRNYRLIAAAIGDKFNDGSSNFTGRHWWGHDADGVPTPIEDDAAQSLACEIGFPPFAADEFGTSILILAPDFGGRTPEQSMNFLVESSLWHLWPKMVPQPSGHVPMEFRFFFNGAAVPIPSFASTPPLGKYVDAFDGLSSVNNQPLGYMEETLTRHALGSVAVLGRLATVPFVREPRRVVDDGHDPEDEDSPRPASPFSHASSHHVALMRSPELVVEYLPGPEAPDPSLEWGGIFRADDSMDEVFANAEPPTHDAWTPDYLVDKQHKLTVQKCLRDIRKSIEGRWGAAPQPEANSTFSTALLADTLSHLVLGTRGLGKGKAMSSPGPKPGPAEEKSGLRANWTDVIQRENGLVSVASFTVTAKSTKPVRISVAIGVAIEGAQRDLTLDDSLALRSVSIGDEEIALTGLEASFDIHPTGSCEFLLEAASSGRSSVLWDVTAVPVEGSSE